MICIQPIPKLKFTRAANRDLCYSLAMETNVCNSCLKPKGVLQCEICACVQCKKCVQTLAPDSFSFLENVPAELNHRHYCGRCYDEKVANALMSYEHTMARARGVFVYFKKQSEETRLMSRSEKPIRVDNCADRDETLLRLAFKAAKANFNALISVDLTAKQIRNAGWQTSRWQGTAIPTRVDAAKLEREAKK